MSAPDDDMPACHDCGHLATGYASVDGWLRAYCDDCGPQEPASDGPYVPWEDETRDCLSLALHGRSLGEER